MKGLYPKTILLVGSAFVAVVIIIMASFYFPESEEVEQEGLARAQVLNRTAFEALYASMCQGGGRDDNRQVIARLQKLGTFTELRVVRGDPIVSQFGADPSELPRDDLERRALAGEEVHEVRWENGYRLVRDLSPLPVQVECQECHQASLGAINGVISTEISLRDYESALRERRDTALLALGGGALAVLLLVFYALQRIVIRPLQKLQQGIAAVAEADLGHRLEVRTGDELKDLASGFNEMAARLQESYASLELKVADRTRELTALNQVAKAVNRSLDLEATLPEVLDQVLALTQAEAADIRLVENGTLCLQAVRGRPPGFLEQEARVPVGHCLCGQAALTGQAAMAGDLASEQPQASRCLADGFCSSLSSPVTVKDQVVGVIHLAAGKSHAFHADHEAFLLAVGQHVGLAIEKARLHNEVKRLNQQLEQQLETRVTELAQTKEAVAQKAHQLEQLLAETVHVQEKERARIARDMHDSLNQLLFGAICEVLAARDHLASNPEVALDKLQVTEKLLGEIKAEIRRTIYGLRPLPVNSTGLVPALEKYAASYQELVGIPCSVRVSGAPLKLAPDTEVAIYRIVQEALHNVGKHAQAKTAQLSVDFGPARLSVTVQDDGSGFDYPEALKNSTSSVGRLGLIGMRERARDIGGEIDVRSMSGQGTSVVVSVPIQDSRL